MTVKANKYKNRESNVNMGRLLERGLIGAYWNVNGAKFQKDKILLND